MAGKLVGAHVALLLTAVAAWAQDAQVREAVAKADGWTSYKMTSEVTVDEKVAGGGSKSQTDPSEVIFEKDKGLWLKSAKRESITVDAKTVIKGKDGTWGVKAPKKSKNPQDQGQPPAAAAALPPHQSLRGLEKTSEVTAADENENHVYTIVLQKEGAASIMGDLIKSASKATEEPKCTAKLWVDKDGNIVKLEVQCTFTTKSAKSGDEKTTTVKRVTTFKDINSTKLEVPEEAKKALEAN